MTLTRGGLISWAAAAIVSGVLLAITWSAQAELPMSPRLIPSFRLEGFAPGVAVAQSVTAARNGLSRIDIGIPPSEMPTTVEALVRSHDGAIVVRQRIALSENASRSEARLSFEPVQDSAGRTFVIEVRGIANSAPLILEGVWADGLRDGQLIDPHRSLAETRDLDMNVRLYQSRTFGEVLVEFLQSEKPAALTACGLSVTLLLAAAATIAKVRRTRIDVALGLCMSILVGVAFLVVRFVIGFG